MTSFGSLRLVAVALSDAAALACSYLSPPMCFTCFNNSDQLENKLLSCEVKGV